MAELDKVIKLPPSAIDQGWMLKPYGACEKSPLAPDGWIAVPLGEQLQMRRSALLFVYKANSGITVEVASRDEGNFRELRRRGLDEQDEGTARVFEGSKAIVVFKRAS